MPEKIILELDQNDLAVIIRGMNGLTIGEGFQTAVKINQQIAAQQLVQNVAERDSERPASA